MKVWLDDERKMPDNFDIHVKTASQAIELLKTGQVEYISLDHDLGCGDGTGYDVAKYIEQAAYYGEIPKVNVAFHTQNPIGKENMKTCIHNTYKFWNEVLGEIDYN